MTKYHTGYFLSLSQESFTPQEYSKELIKESYLSLIHSNYKGNDYSIEWIYNDNLSGLEFIIDTKSYEIAQNVLFIVLCSAAVIEGTVMWSNEAHYPHEFGLKENVKEFDLLNKPFRAFTNIFVPQYFYLSSLSSNNNRLANSIIKYQLSTEIYSNNYKDLHEVINWNSTSFNYIQMRFAYAIITAYSVIEELGLDIRASKDKPSKLENGDWNPEILSDLIMRLESSKINMKEDISWMIRGPETEIKKKKPIKINRLTAWAGQENFVDSLLIKDGYVFLPDAIHYISFLRSKISSHCVADRIMKLSVFDVANAQFLARRLILESTGLWKLN